MRHSLYTIFQNLDFYFYHQLQNLLDFPYPIENESFENIYLRHVIEHFYLNDFEKILNECYRILISDGLLRITVPHAFSIAAFTDPTHKQFFTFGTGYFWDKKYQKSYWKYPYIFKMVYV